MASCHGGNRRIVIVSGPVLPMKPAALFAMVVMMACARPMQAVGDDQDAGVVDAGAVDAGTIEPAADSCDIAPAPPAAGAACTVDYAGPPTLFPMPAPDAFTARAPQRVAFRSAGGELVAVYGPSILQKWDLAGGSVVDPPMITGLGDFLTGAFSDDGELAAIRWAFIEVDISSVYSVVSANRTLDLGFVGMVSPALSATGDWLAYLRVTWALDPSHGLVVRNLKTGAILSAPGFPSDWPDRSLAFSRNGRRLAAVDRAANVHLWCVPAPPADGDLRLLASWQTADEQIVAVALTPDASILVTGATSSRGDSTLRFWRNGQPFAPPVVLAGIAIRYLTFSPDGSVFAAVAGSEVRLFTAAGSPVATLEGKAAFNDVAFDPDGRRLAFAADDGAGYWQFPCR